MKVNLYWALGKRKNDQFEVYRRCSQAFANIGVHLHFFPNETPIADPNCDVVVMQHYVADSAAITRVNCPVVIEETENTLYPVSSYLLTFPEVIRFYKYAVVSGSLLPTYATQVKPGIHIGMFNRIQRWIDRPTYEEKDWSQRPIDVLFAGRISPDIYRPKLAKHRALFCDELDRIQIERPVNVVCKRDRVYSLDQYLQLSRMAKIVVSPWGHGELCYRDFEAMLDGCLLIKPRPPESSRVLGGIMDSSHYIDCFPDASDLADTITHHLRYWRDYQLLLRGNQKLASHWFNPDTIAAWWKADIESCLK